jgi:hypothetical protein
MRNGILDQLPKTLAKEQVVLVFGPPEDHGQNALKSLINDLNRKDGVEWIRSEFRTQVEGAKVSNRTAVVLTMNGLTHGALANVRRMATNFGACCPNQALTMGETKEILRTLAQARQSVPVNEATKWNGNENHPTSNKSAAQRSDDLARIGQQARAAFSETLRQVTAESVQSDDKSVLATAREWSTVLETTDSAMGTSHVETEDPDALHALAAIKKFRDVSDEAELAMMVVGDRLKEMAASREELLKQLSDKDDEIAKLRKELEAARTFVDESISLAKKNSDLEADIRNLRTTLDQFENIIKRARQK